MQEPSTKQLQEFVSIACLLTAKCFVLCFVKRDEQTGDLFIFANDELEIMIDVEGAVKYDRTLETSESDKVRLRDHVVEHRDDNEAFHQLTDLIRENAQSINTYQFMEILEAQSSSLVTSGN